MLDRRYFWALFYLGAFCIVMAIFGLFWVVELNALGQAPRDVVASLHLVLGVGTSLLILSYALYFLLERMQAAEAHAHQAREAERRLFVFLQHMPMAVFALDRNGHVVFANQRAATLLGTSMGANPAGGPISQELQALVAGTDDPYPEARLPVVRALDGEEDAFAHDLEIIRGDGRVPLEAWANPVRDAEGRIVYAVAAFQDVSDRRKAEEERLHRIESERDLERIRELDALRTRFVNIAAHELFTPLTPLRLQVRYLQHSLADALEPKQSHALEVIDRNFARLQRVVDQILEVSQLQGEALETISRPTDLAAIVADAGDRLQKWADERRVRVEHDVPDGRVLVEGNAARLEKVVTNLVENAIKFSPAKATVNVRLDAKDGEAVFEVHDQGNGMEPAEDDDVFRPFRRATETKGDEAGEGLGMGLYVAKTIVERHGGRIWLSSDGKGRGARAGFALPLAEASRTGTPPATVSKGT